MTFAEAKQKYEELQAAADVASKAMRVFPRGEMGLTPDHVKASIEWRTAHANYARCAADLRKWNQFYQQCFRKEIRAERKSIIEKRTKTQVTAASSNGKAAAS